MIQLECITNWRKALTLSACFVFTLAISSACKKSSAAPFGTDVFSIDDLIASGATESFDLLTYTVLEDSIRTDNQNFAILGAYGDPKLGKFNASFYTQLMLDGSPAFLGTEVFTVDSVVLSLRYQGFYGKTDAQTFQVYEVGEDMKVDSAYYKSSVIATTGSDLMDPSSATQIPRPTERVVLAPGDTVSPHLRLKLDNSLGDRFLNDAIAGNTAFDSDENFVGYFKGFQVSVQNQSPASGAGGVLYFNLNNSVTNLTVYYTVQGEVDQRELTFVVKDGCADFNHVDVNNSGYDIQNTINNPSNVAKSFYAQANNSRAVVQIPYLSTIPKKAVIHNALLVLPVEFQTSGLYFPSLLVDLSFKNISGEFIPFQPYAYNDSEKAFVIDIRSFVQDVVNDKAENSELYFNTVKGSTILPTFGCSAERIIFNGPGTLNKKKPRIIVKYTEF